MCLDRQTLSAYIDNEVSGEWQRKIQEHLQRCPQCNQVYAFYLKLSRACVPLDDEAVNSSMERVENRIAAKVSSYSSPSLWKRRITIPVPVAAAATFLVGALLTVSFIVGFRNTETGAPLDNSAALALYDNLSLSEDEPLELTLQEMEKLVQFLLREPNNITFTLEKDFKPSGVQISEPQLYHAVDYQQAH